MLNTPAGGDPMLLIVDDSETSRYVKRRILRQAGYEIAEAATGAEALTAIKFLRPDLMVLDIGLPDITGFAICQRVKSDPATASVMVLEISATYVKAADTANALESGADACLTEPIEPAVLLATVRSLLRLREARESLARTNATLNSIISSSPAAIITLDNAARIRGWNPAAERIFGWSEADLIGKSASLLSGDIGENLRSLIAQPSDSRNGIETRCSRKDGTTAAVAIFGAPLLDGGGAPAGAVLMAVDISVRKWAEQQREQLLQRERDARHAAEDASRAKDQFLAVLSHELRSPLNAILTWVSFLQKGDADPRKAAQALEAIERNARLQTELIGDLLDVSRIITGKLRLEIGPVDLATVIDEALETVRPTADSKQIRIATMLEPVREVPGDPARLEQVAWNLLSNAVKFTPPGGAIDVSLRQIDSGIELSVRDTGIGIAPEFLPRVFDRFRQADASSTRSEGGLGLGLAIVRHLVELHGGTVRADSEGAGHGAAFTVSLPAPAAASPARKAPETAPADKRTGRRLGGVHILVVDDEFDARDALAALLELDGARVTTSPSAADALKQAEQVRPDVIISDIAMAKEDGIELIRRIRTHGSPRIKEIPAIALTGYATPDDKRTILGAGYQVYLTKPVKTEELIEGLAALARKPGNVQPLKRQG